MGEEDGGEDVEDEWNRNDISNIFQGDAADTLSDVSSNEEEMGEDEEMENSEQEENETDVGDEYETDFEYEEHYNQVGDEYETDVEEEDEDYDQETNGEPVNEEEEWSQNNIPVIVTNRSNWPPSESNERGQCSLQQVRVNDRVASSAELPTIAVTNFRSLGPRVRNVKDDMLLRGIEVQIGSETWEKEDNRKLKSDLEEILEIDGLQYISCPRPNKKRGGGAAIMVHTIRFTITKLNIIVPAKLEVVWGLLRPKNPTKDAIFKEFIICAFYSPPNYKKNNALQTHIIGTMHHLLTLHPKAAYCIAGDKNSLPISPIIAALPRCKQAVTLNTYKEKILDVILWNMSQFYAVPYIAPAVQPDNPATHSPSDHKNAVAVPLAGAGTGAVTREYSVKTSRPLPDSGKREFGLWLANTNWEELLAQGINSEEQDCIMRNALECKLNQIFPEKKCRISNQDFSFITADLKKLKKYIIREYKLRGKTAKYCEMKLSYDTKFSKAAKDQLNKFVEDMMNEHPGRAYQAMKKMGARPGDCANDGIFFVTSHQNENLSLEQSTDRILKYFSAISQEYLPFDILRLPEDVQSKLRQDVNSVDIPIIQPFQVFEKWKKCKKTKSSVPGELPARLRQEFSVELSEPAAIIFNNVAQSSQWPQTWKKEFGTILKKENLPEDESMLRVISITYQLSTIMERFVIDWLLVYIEDKLDRDQFGGQQGHSISHYLIELINFILYNQDLSKPLATLLAAIDLQKGFNKIDHCKLVTIFSRMQVPCWLLKLVVSYLSGRTLTLRHRGHTSSTEQMPGGLAAGAPLGLFCFLVMFSDAGPPASQITIGEQITKPKRQRKPMEISKVKWIDDKSLTVSLDLASSLVPDTRPDIPRPVPYRGRLGLMLPRESNVLQDEVDSLCQLTSDRLMSINRKKTKIMLFSRMKKYDFLPEIKIGASNENLEFVEEMKIVGFILRSDLKTVSNTKYILKKAYSRLWIIRRLKALGASRRRLIDVLQKQVLSALQLGVAAWESLLSSQERTDLERLLKVSLRIIWGQDYISYKQALSDSKLLNMQQTRDKTVNKFLRKSIKHPKFRKWFCIQDKFQIETRRPRTTFKPVTTRTARYAKSAIPTLTNIANTMPAKTWGNIT